MADLAILTAEEFKTLESLERQATRRAGRQQPLAQLILRTFLERGGPIPIAGIIAALPEAPADATLDALAALDDDDLIRVRAGHVDVAYPFSAAATPFLVQLPGGGDRYACCATDALGIAPMIGERVEIGSTCHHCGALLKFGAGPHGVGPEAEGVMLWFGKRSHEGYKACDSL